MTAIRQNGPGESEMGGEETTRREPHKGAGHRKRLRERFLNAGLSGFHDYEVIELLLTLATPVRDCKDPAKAALKKFGSLRGVVEAPADSLREIKGIGPVNVFGIKLIKAVSDRYLEERLREKALVRNSRELFDFLYHNKQNPRRESFTAVFLDAKNRVIASETLFTGTLTSSSVYPREVISAAIERGSAALIFAHNHPSGDPQPSREDIAITRRLLFACRAMGIRVHEHIIVGDDRYFSFADEGFIGRMNDEYDQHFTAP